MSDKLSFREQLEQQAGTAASSPAQSFSPADIQIELRNELASPVSLALLLRDNGLSLANAHAAIGDLAVSRSITLTVHPRSLRDLLRRLMELGLVAHAVRDAGRFRVLVPADFLPDDIPSSTTQSVLALGSELSGVTIGDLRRVYGETFAKNYKSSARVSEVVYSLDRATLEAVAANQNDPAA